MAGSSNDPTYAAGQAREFLRGELRDKPNEWVREFAGLIDDRRTLDLLNYYCSLWNDDPESGDFLDTRLARTIIRSAATGTMDEAFRAGNISQLQGAVGLSSKSEDGGDALGTAARRLAHEGAIGLVFGPPGSGKTALTLDVARAWAARTGGDLIGNTDWDGYDSVVTSDREMLTEMAEREGQVLAVVDETAQELSGYGEDANAAQEFSNRLLMVRKAEEDHGPHAKRGSVLLVSHTRVKTAAALRRVATLALEKPSRSDPSTVRLLETEGGRDSFDEAATFQGVTDTRENYPEHEASRFDVTTADDADDDGDGLDADDVRRTEAIATVLRAVKPWSDDGGLTYSDAAGLVDFSASWVGDRVGEWKDGDHRELVDAPGGGSE